MEIGANEIIFALADSLDAVETEFLGAKESHSRRVAYMSICMGKKLGLTEEEVDDLALSAALHDNALTEARGRNRGFYVSRDDVIDDTAITEFAYHCYKGQENLKKFPFLTDFAKEAVLYHHEQADGNGAFKKKPDEIPIAAKIIHLSDTLDNWSRGNCARRFDWNTVKNYVSKNNGILFSDEIVKLFFATFNIISWHNLNSKDINLLIKSVLPERTINLSNQEMESICHVFAEIVDNKSPFTMSHSQDIAKKAQQMGRYYNMSEDDCYKLLFAGYLHDIGKMMIPNSILEKPGKLSPEEYEKMKLHVTYSYQILSKIPGLGEITSWACNHHERLDGSGYPWGKSAKNLDKMERLLADIDVYQALREDRPYRKGLSHETTMEMINGMVKAGKLDGDIASDINRVFR
jgi:HD-GYP domain-containing protein (c-di-GMP phosphodiesterase class II)